MTFFAVRSEKKMSKAMVIPDCNKDIGNIKEEISVSPSDKKDGAMSLFSRLLRFESLKRNSSPESPTSTEPPTTYYGVYIPCEIKKGPDEETIHVYKNKSEALEVVRRYKQARFKAFLNRQDAISFALRGAEPVETTDCTDSPLMGEKPYPFKAPSPQEMVAVRKSIEAGLATTVRDRVWDNPRYLISSGNTPAIMQEGCRYNALHVAAKAKNAEMCNLILTTVGNPSFVQTLYGADADAESCKEFAEILLDRYLNTPDKARNETPLHFAACFGAEEVVDLLTSFPQCNRHAVNKAGEEPKDVICKRVNVGEDVARRIAEMLGERYYVPVLHSEDESAAPMIGAPFTPASPPELNKDPLSPRVEIRAFAGPMRAGEALAFRRRWKTPLKPPAFRLNDIAKGLEGVGRNLAGEMKVGWKEYWPFLDTFTDLRSVEGLSLLENYLKAKYENACSFIYNDSCLEAQHQQTVDDMSFSRLSLNNLSSSPIKDMSPMSELCAALKTCKISSDRPPHWRKTDPIRQRLCRQPTAKLTNGDTSPPPVINHTVSELLCIERTCKVFAKRIADALTFSLTAEPEVAGDSLKSEAKHLQHTIFTYMDDERFKKIDFALIHSRLAQLIVHELKQHTKEMDDINSLVEFLIKLRCPNDDIFSSDDERKPANYRGTNRVKSTQVIDAHVRCLASFLCEELSEGITTKGPAVSEGECSEIWEKAAKCRCDWKIESFERNSKKNASFRKNRSSLSAGGKLDNIIRRLNFDHDMGDGRGCGTTDEAACDPPASPNSPAGDNLYTVDVANCQVVSAEISDDDTDEGGGAASSDEYQTASEHSGSEDEMEDASDRALAEPFIYGEEPTKMDRLVYDAVSECEVNREQFPNVFRWRHAVGLYTPAQREKWQPAPTLDDTSSSYGWTVSVTGSPCARTRNWPCMSPCLTSSPLAMTSSPVQRSTPQKDFKDNSRALSLQVSNWLRVTGPNSPRSALATKNVGQNVSFGF